MRARCAGIAPVDADPQPSEAAPPGNGPWGRLRSAAFRPFIYRKMVRQASPDDAPGDVVTVLDRHGAVFGSALNDLRSEIVLWMFTFGQRPADERLWTAAIESGVASRRDVLRSDAGAKEALKKGAGLCTRPSARRRRPGINKPDPLSD